ncbi:putative Actin-like ATPase domain-containing protein [Seiridium cardinale]
MTPNASLRKLVIAIDFGTTFSGIGYWIGRDDPVLEQIHVICEWPADMPFDGEKPQVPTLMWYGKDDSIFWGNLIPEDAEPIQWFKLLLLEREDLPLYLQQNPSHHLETAKKRLQEQRKDAVTVVADYLSQLWQYAIMKIREIKTTILVDDCFLHVVLTVPAIWKGYARQRMRIAVERAGILNPSRRGPVSFSMISEPEAAAHATLRSSDFQNHEAQTKDVILMCDGGGGTVDVISYIINDIGSKQLRECVEGDGDLCGAVFVDEVFEKYIKERVGPQFWEETPVADITYAFSTDWENGIKRGFDGSCRLTRFRIGGRNIDLNEIEIEDCFRSVVSKVKALIFKQIQAIKQQTGSVPKFIFLVGGFGRNQWLYNCLAKAFPESRVIKGTGDEPWSAVCRGAALAKAIELCASEMSPDEQANPVLSRKPRSSQGWLYDEVLSEFNTAEDRDKAEWNDVRGTWMVHDLIQWLVTRGQDVSTQSETKSYTIFLPMDTKGYWSTTERIFESPSAKPPLRYRAGDPDIKDTGRRVTLKTPVRAKELPIEANELGEPCRAFHIDWNITVDGATLSAVAYSEGQEVGRLEEFEV